MKPFNLKEYLKNPSRKVITRDGRAVKIYCTDYIDKCGMFVIAKIEGNAYSYSFREDGRFLDHKETDNDLFFDSEKHEGYACVHFNEGIYYLDDTIFSSKEEAYVESKKWADFIATVKVEWEE